MKPIRTAAPASLLTLEEVKAFCRVDHSDDDTVLQALATAAVDYLDGYAGVLGRCLVTQTWVQGYTLWGDLRLWCGNVASAVVTYRDASGASATVNSSLYEIVQDNLGAVIAFKPDFTSPALSEAFRAPITVTFVAGYGAPDAVPQPLRVAALMWVQYSYENRGAQVSEFPMAFHALIAPYRMAGV